MTTTTYTIELGTDTITTNDPSKAERYSQQGYTVRAETSDGRPAPKATIEVESNGHERRIQYVDREDGRVDRYEQTKTNADEWRAVGHEVIDDVSIAFE